MTAWVAWRVATTRPEQVNICDIAVLAERVDRISARCNMGAFYVNYTVKGVDLK
jgi:hypothetical protein